MEATINDVMFGQSSPVSDLCSFQSPGSSNKRLGATARETIFQLYDPSLAIFPRRKHAAPSRSTIEPRDSARENQIDPHSEHHIYTKNTHTCPYIYVYISACIDWQTTESLSIILIFPSLSLKLPRRYCFGQSHYTIRT